MNKKILFLFLIMYSFQSFCQVKTAEDILNTYAENNKLLTEKIRIDVSGLTIYEFLNSIASEHKINVSADSDLNTVIESSFFDIPVKDVFLFVVKKYDLDIEIINNIIVFKKRPLKREVPKVEKPKEIEVSYNNQNKFLSLKLKDDDITKVTQKITDLTGVNFVISPKIKDKKVSAYILNRPLEDVLNMMAKSNKMIVNSEEQGFYYLDENTEGDINVRKKNKEGVFQKISNLKSTAEIKIESNGFLTIKAYDAEVTALIAKVAEELNINYFMYDKPDGVKTTLVAEMFTFDQLLDHVFKGKEYTFKKKDDFYLIGKQNTEGLRVTELVQLENRTIETILETLPKDLVENVEIKEFFELNGFVVSGSRRRIQEIKEYVKQIDQVVPMILIEVLIVQYQKSSDVQTGLRAALDKDAKTTSGVIFPTTDVTLNATSVNSLIDAFNGFGIFNLGKVTKDFYLNLTALENNSIIKLKSTPKISTLNGHEAKLSIGETSYYFEQNNRLVNRGVGNNDILQSGQWKSTDANLSVIIKPYVSKDEQITLNIVVERSTFLGRQGENAPPGKATQQFESLVRCKNGEMILMGGLNESERENSGTGTPWLSRVPVIKWFFSSKKKRKSKSKLHIFIKPTVVY